MCKVYNAIGSLTTLKSELGRNNICEFKSLKEVIAFQKSYLVSRQNLIFLHEDLIKQEKENLEVNLPILKTSIETKREQSRKLFLHEIDKLKSELEVSEKSASKNIFQSVKKSLKNWEYIRKIKHKELSFESEIEFSVTHLIQEYQIKNNRNQFINSKFNEAVKKSASNELSQLERKKTILDGLNNYIYGALGEQQVVKTLQNLSDDYYLINDFALSFSQAIYNRQENDYIKSVQIDHILVGPSGIFIIETKNWSEKSMESLSLRSPVEQIKRTSFALFYILNNVNSNYQLRLDSHHWGDKKISIKNLVVLTNTRPKEEFQYVKILTTNELINYVNYFKPIYSTLETSQIAETLLWLNK